MSVIVSLSLLILHAHHPGQTHRGRKKKGKIDAYNTRDKISSRRHCHAPSPNVCRIDLATIDETRSIDKETIEEHEEEYGEDGNTLTSLVRGGHNNEFSEHSGFKNKGDEESCEAD